MKELQEDVCHAWEMAAGNAYRPESDEYYARYFRTGLEMGFSRKMFRDRRMGTQYWKRLQQLCERYHRHYEKWPERCCDTAQLIAKP